MQKTSFELDNEEDKLLDTSRLTSSEGLLVLGKFLGGLPLLLVVCFSKGTEITGVSCTPSQLSLNEIIVSSRLFPKLIELSCVVTYGTDDWFVSWSQIFFFLPGGLPRFVLDKI